MMQQLILGWPALMNGLFQSIKDKSGSGGATDTPSDYSVGKDVNDEGHIHKPLPCRDIGSLIDLPRSGSLRFSSTACKVLSEVA